MSKKIIFYGGCQGVNKSTLLTNAINIVQLHSSIQFETILLSGYFEKYIKTDKGNADAKTLWCEDAWKKHENKVVTDLIEEIKRTNKINIINNHFSVPFMGKDNYVPGIDQHNLEKLLFDIFFNGAKEKILPDFPCFGLLLIDPEPALINNHYKDLYLNSNRIKAEDEHCKTILKYLNTIMNYISEEEIKKDLEQNRIWAKLYCDTAIAVLGRKYVEYETLYITKKQIENGYSDINNKIAEFLKQFIN